MGKVSTKNKKNKTNKTIDKMMGSPMEKIDKLIKQAKDLNKPKKRFDKGGSNMAKKNFSSKELMMKSQYAQKNEKPKTFKEAFAAARKKLGPGKVFTFKGKKYTTDLASEKKKSKSTKKKSTVKTISSKANPLKKFTTPVKKQTKTPQGEQIKNMAQQKMTAEDNIRRQIAAAKKTPTITSSYKPGFNKGGSPKLKKMNKGGVFKGIF
jgi:hypothetical protein